MTNLPFYVQLQKSLTVNNATAAMDTLKSVKELLLSTFWPNDLVMYTFRRLTYFMQYRLLIPTRKKKKNKQ